MGNIQESIIRAMDARNMSQAELSRRSNVPKSSLSRYLNGDEMPASKLKAIATALDMSSDALLGIDTPLVLSVDELRLVTLYRKMDTDNREKFLGIAPTFVVASEKDGSDDERTVGVGAVDAVRS